MWFPKPYPALIFGSAQGGWLGGFGYGRYLSFGHLTQFPMANTTDDGATTGAEGGQAGGRRIAIAAARKMLGMIGRNYSDADIAEILDCLYGFAEEAFDLYQHPPDTGGEDGRGDSGQRQ